MAEIRLELDEKGHGSFYLSENGEAFGEMVIAVQKDILTVHHTEVSPQAEGKGYAKQMFQEAIAYARKHQLHIAPLCQYVHTQLKRRPDEYSDVWKGA
jgi:hypothetical protein